MYLESFFLALPRDWIYARRVLKKSNLLIRERHTPLLMVVTYKTTYADEFVVTFAIITVRLVQSRSCLGFIYLL
jgi:hypothetical protein